MSTPPFTEAVTSDVLRVPIVFVNAYAIGSAGGPWVMLDTGLMGAASYLQGVLEAYMDGPPQAIVLTHGHFDHAGNAAALADAWDVPIYAHREELPFLNGSSDYPPGDSSMGGAIAQMARAFPASGFDFSSRLKVLPDDGSVPGLEAWQWLHTPGHTPGHISLWRESDRTLLAGDALATMDLDSWLTQVTHERELARPPVPFTPDWDAADESIRMLAELRPAVLAAGHGRSMSEPGLPGQLKRYAAESHRPEYGRYAIEPAQFDEEQGLVSLPAPVEDVALYKLIGGGLAIVAGIALVRGLRKVGQREENIVGKDF